MNSVERILKVANLKEPDRVPVAPHMWYFQPRICGVTHREFIFNPMKGEECSRTVYEKFGGFDLYIEGTITTRYFTDNSFNPSVFSLFWHDWKLPGIDLPDNALPQLDEKTRIDEKAYRVIAEKGLEQFRLRTKNDVEEMYDVDVDQRLSSAKKIMNDTKYWLNKKRVLSSTRSAPIHNPIDNISYMRGLKNWLVDCVYRPDDIIVAAERMLEDYLKKCPWKIFETQISNINIGASHSHRMSASFLSPKQFEKICFPFLKRIVDELSKDFQIVILHLDGNWNPILEYFKEFPKAKCILQLDELTDLVKAKKIIGDHCCLMGNVKSALLSSGSPIEVEKECEHLIEGCKEGGGFILSSSCEVPPETPSGNILAMKEAAVKYGTYE